MNKYNCPPDQFEAYEYQEAHQMSKMPPLSPQFFKNKERLEERRFVQTRAFFNANWGDNDIGYGSYIDE